MDPRVRLVRLVVSVGAVALVTLALLQLREVNPTTVALTYVVAILAIATAWESASRRSPPSWPCSVSISSFFRRLAP